MSERLAGDEADRILSLMAVTDNINADLDVGESFETKNGVTITKTEDGIELSEYGEYITPWQLRLVGHDD